MSNGIRISFVEWLYRMSDAGLPLQARIIAIHAACFDVTGNKDLGDLCGIRDERTIRKWKADLVKSGWVIVGQKGGGRGKGIRVHAALRGAPVSFSDIRPQNPCKLCTRLEKETLSSNDAHSMQNPSTECTAFNVETPTSDAGVSDDTPARNVPHSVQTPTSDAPSRAPPHARIETPSGLLISDNLNTTSHPSNLDAAREGERGVGQGVFVNCETVRHRDFTINLQAVEMQLLAHAGSVSSEQIRDFTTACALQWATELADGTRTKSNLPRQIARSVASYITNQLNQQAEHEVRKKREEGQSKPKTPSHMRRY